MEYIVVDIETTGLSKYVHKITEVAAVRLKNGKVVDEFQSLVNPECHIPSFITRLTGINDTMVKDAPTIKPVIAKFMKFARKDVFVAHNASFDYGFLYHAAELHHKKKISNERICTRKLANRLLPFLGSKRLSALCEHFQVRNDQAHRAMGDVLATSQIFLKMTDLLEQREITTPEQILRFQNISVGKTFSIRL